MGELSGRLSTAAGRRGAGPPPEGVYCRAVEPKGPGMTGAPDQYADEARRHAADLQRAMQRDRRSETRKLARIRLILRRVLGRENPSGSP